MTIDETIAELSRLKALHGNVRVTHPFLDTIRDVKPEVAWVRVNSKRETKVAYWMDWPEGYDEYRREKGEIVIRIG